MDYKEIVCVHLNLKFLIIKNSEKNEDCVSDNFCVRLADSKDIEVVNKSKEYFIRKLHKLLKRKRKKKNEYECILSGTITEVANFLFQHLELLIEIQRDGNDEDDTKNMDHGPNSMRPYGKKERPLEGGIRTNKIHLLKSVDMEDTHFENDRIYFKCFFSDLITDFEFFENKRFENISNFYIADDLVFSICIKLEECLIEKKDIEKMKISNYPNMDKYDFRYKHILEIFDLNSFYYLYFNFNNYTKQFFYDNDVEIIVGEMLQNLSDKIRRNNETNVTNTSNNKNNSTVVERDMGNSTKRGNSMKKGNSFIKLETDVNMGCHFSLIFIESVEELFHYFAINDIYININNIHLNVDKKLFMNLDEGNGKWIKYNDFKQITFLINTPNAGGNNEILNNNTNLQLQFDMSIICIFLDDSENQIDLEYRAVPNVYSLSVDHFNSMENSNMYANGFAHMPVPEGGSNMDYRMNKENYVRSSEHMNQYTNMRMKGNLSFDNINVDVNEKRKPVVMRNISFTAMKGEICTKKEYNSCNFFVSVNKCHILELSNIYAEKNKRTRNNFLVKMGSDLFKNQFISPLYLFQEDSIIELKNCHLSIDFLLEEENDLYNTFVGKSIFFDLCLKEEDNEVNIGKGELNLTTVINDLMQLLQNEREQEQSRILGIGHGTFPTREPKWNNYFKFAPNVFIFLNVFKEKFLTAELSLEIFFRLMEKKTTTIDPLFRNAERIKGTYMYEGNNKTQSIKEIREINEMNEMKEMKEKTSDHIIRATTISRIETTNFENKIPSNIYEFKMWKEEEEERMKLLLKKKEESLTKKFIKKYELFEKERKSEYETKKNELKEIMIKIKEEQLNIINHNNLLNVKEKQLNEEIHILDNKLKKIKYAYEKSLFMFKENLRKTNLNESILHENKDLREKYRLVITERKQLKKENEEMGSLLKKYNNKDNMIISSSYFDKLKEELKHLKECKRKMMLMLKKEEEEKKKEKGEDGDDGNDGGGIEMKNNQWKYNEKILGVLQMVHNNRTKYLNFIVNFILHLEELYDLTNEETLEDKFQTVLTEINIMKTVINKELKELDIVMEICAPLSLNDKENDKKNDKGKNSNDVDNRNDVDVSFENIDSSFIKQKERCLKFHKKVSIDHDDIRRAIDRDKDKDKNKNKDKDRNIDKNKDKNIYRKDEKKGSTKLIDKREEPIEKIERSKLDRIAKKEFKGKGSSLQISNKEIKGNSNKKIEENTRIIENLKSEIKRLVQSGIYNEDDEIIKRMKQKLVTLLH